MAKPKQSMEEEILARTRRIETRLTQLLIAQGIRTEASKPQFHLQSSTVQIPSIHSSLQEILDSLPRGWQGPITIRIGDTRVAELTS